MTNMVLCDVYIFLSSNVANIYSKPELALIIIFSLSNNSLNLGERITLSESS